MEVHSAVHGPAGVNGFVWSLSESDRAQRLVMDLFCGFPSIYIRVKGRSSVRFI